MKKLKKTNLTVADIEKQVQDKLMKMYEAFPDAETENTIERAVAIKLGGKAAEAFFK